MTKTAVIGAGLIGRSWAIVFARAGFDVALWDPVAEAVPAALEFARARLPELAEHGLLRGQAPDAVLARMRQAATPEEAIAGVDWVQENGPERRDAKRDLFARLDRAAPAACVLASSPAPSRRANSAPGCRAAARVLVAHPVNPPYLVPVVELSPAPWTDPAVVQRARAFMESAGMVPATVQREVQGFLLNRLQAALLGEAFRLVEDGIATQEDVDATIKHGLGLRWAFMGPFETIDLNAPAGLADYCARYGAVLHEMQQQMTPRAWGEDLVRRLHAVRRAALPAERPGGTPGLARPPADGAARPQDGPTRLTRGHPMRACRRLLLVALLLLVPLGGALAQRGPRIWFAPIDPYFKARVFQNGFGDFDNLFQPGAPWMQAAARVSVFKLATSYVLAAPDPELRAVIAWVQQHRMALAMEGPMLNPPQADCGRVESYGAPRTIAAAQKIARLGGRLDILTAQEALWFGHFYNGRSACHSPVPELVAQPGGDGAAAAGDLPRPPHHRYRADLEFPRSRLGECDRAVARGLPSSNRASPMPACEIDIAWWQPRLAGARAGHRRLSAQHPHADRRDLQRQCPRAARLQLGAAGRAALARIRTRRGRARRCRSSSPGRRNPSRLLPETAPDAFTSALMDYERFHP